MLRLEKEVVLVQREKNIKKFEETQQELQMEMIKLDIETQKIKYALLQKQLLE